MSAGPAQRPIPFLLRVRPRYTIGGALLGLALSGVVVFSVFRPQDRPQPPEPISGAGIGRSFDVSFASTVQARVTVISGERRLQFNLASITLKLRIEARSQYRPDTFAWHVAANGSVLKTTYASFSSTIDRTLSAGQSAEGTIALYGLPADEQVTITYQSTFDDAPVYTLVVDS